MKISFAAFCETGNREGRNQDRIFAASDKKSGLFLVADGMGGHSDGAYASGCIREETERLWEESRKDPECSSNNFYMEEMCIRALTNANSRIQAGISDSEVCGSTAVLIYLNGEDASLFSCGDSRCYMYVPGFLRGRLKQLSVDDVWENSPAVKGFSRKEIRIHKNRGKLCRAVGTEKRFSCNTYRFRLGRRCLLMLCSDGIYKYIPEKRIRERLRKAAQRKVSLAETAERIREEVYEAGAPDNLSLILVLYEK